MHPRRAHRTCSPGSAPRIKMRPHVAKLTQHVPRALREVQPVAAISVTIETPHPLGIAPIGEEERVLGDASFLQELR